MLRLLYFSFTLLILFFLNSANSHYYDNDITHELKGMVENPSGNPGRESFSASVTRPYIQGAKSNTDFFAKPGQFRSDWNQQYNRLNSTQRGISAFGIFETMGPAFRAISNDKNQRYRNIAAAQREGMLGIVKGELKLSNRALSQSERETVAKELLNIGRSLGENVFAKITEFERLYRAPTADANKKRHFQKSALALLAGYDRQSIDRSKWYLAGLDVNSVLHEIKGYADRFLPAISPRDIVIDRLNYEEPNKAAKVQEIFGTKNIPGSSLHAHQGEARYPKAMVLGSHKIPTKTPQKLFSITAEVALNRTLVIMRPEDNKDPVLRPHYGEYQADVKNSGVTNVRVRYLDKSEEDLRIDWNVEAPSGQATDFSGIRDLRDARNLSSLTFTVKPTKRGSSAGGSLNLASPRKKFLDDDDEESYSFITRTLDTVPEKRSYFWCPTASQLGQIQAFTKAISRPFTLGELYDYIQTFSDDIEVPAPILEELRKVMNGTLEGFQR